MLPAVLLIALLEVAAVVPLLIALQRGPVAIASVVASLYPVTTVILAAFVLRERLSRLQYVGVVLRARLGGARLVRLRLPAS